MYNDELVTSNKDKLCPNGKGDSDKISNQQ